MKKILSVLCVSMIFSGVRGADVPSVALDVSAQEAQLNGAQASRLKRMLAWVEQNKACLTGCSDWASFLANYTLGAVIQLGQGMILSAADKIYARGFKGATGRELILEPILMEYLKDLGVAARQPDLDLKRESKVAKFKMQKKLNDAGFKAVDIAGLVAQLGFIATLFSLTERAIRLSYETIVAKTEPLSWWQTVRCLVGKECTLDQQRSAFFTAGRLSGGTLGSIAYNLLQNFFKKTTR